MQHGDRRIRVLVVVIAIDAVFAASLRLDLLLHGHLGGTGWRRAEALVALVWLVVLFAVLVWTIGHVRSLRRRVARGEQAISADETTSHEWVWECSPDLVWTYSNRRVRDLLGYSPEDLIGRSALELLPCDDARYARRLAAAALDDECGWNDVELRWRHADGYLVPLQGSAGPIRDDCGRLVGFRGSRRAAPTSTAAEREVPIIHRRIDELLAAGTLGVALQPVVCLATGRLLGVETLSRFPDDRPPELWFREAREAARGVELELHAIRTALDVLPHLPPTATMALNASPELILDPQFAQTVSAAGVPLERLVIEVTEHVPIARYEDVDAALRPMRLLGLRLAVDDAGAGYASFNHVMRLRPDIIKLDRSLIVQIGTDPARRALITAMVLIALELGATVTAEGVERADELEVLAALGIDAAQGYLLARPTVDPAQWATWPGRTWPHTDSGGRAAAARMRDSVPLPRRHRPR